MAKLDHAKRVLKYEIIGLMLLALGMITLGDLGAVGQALDDLCVTVAGNWHFLIPVYVMWMAVIVMIRRNRFRYTGFQIGLMLWLLVILAWSEMALYTQAVNQYGTTAPDLLHITRVGIASLSQSLRVLVLAPGGAMPPADAGGGMLGYALFAGLKYLFAVTGTLLVLVLAGIVGTVLMTRKSVVGAIGKGSAFFERGVAKAWSRAAFFMARALLRRRPPAAGTGPEGGRGAPDAGPVRKARRKTRGAGKGPSDGEKEPDAFAAEAGRPVEEEGGEPDLSAQNSFPFPDFGVPYPEEPVYEDFLTDRREPARGDADSGAAGALQGAEVHLDESRGRMTLRLPVSAPAPLAPDPLPPRVSGAAGIHGEAPGADAAGSAAGGDKPAPSPRPYRLPDARLLDRVSTRRGESGAAAGARDLQAQAKKLSETFESFGVMVKVLGYSRGPTVTRYEIQPAVGVKVSRILNLTDDLALALAARDIRIEAPIPGKSAVGIEVPNREIAVVGFREVLETEAFSKAESLLSFALGKDIAGNTVIGDLAKMPHVLVAGATGSGKSVCINGIIASILFRARPDDVKFIMIDPKMVELGIYNGIPHLFAPVVTDARRAAGALRKVISEMDQRYALFHQARVRDLERYNAYARREGKPTLPLIVVIIDELADLMMVAPGDVEDAICRLAQMARAAGIHLVVATQRPSVDVITGLIKANIPSRIAFSVSSAVDSRTILDSGGAERLLGRGDMLYLPVGASKPLRIQGAYLSEQEVERLVDFTRRQQEAEYLDDFSQLPDDRPAKTEDLDPLFEEALRLVLESEQATVSYLQRKLKVGYARAARLVDTLEQFGVVGPYENSKPREIRMTMEQWLERQSSMG